MTVSNRRPSRCKRGGSRENGGLLSIQLRMEREQVMNQSETADHLRTTVLSNSEVAKLSPSELHAYFAPVLEALDLDGTVDHFEPAPYVPPEPKLPLGRVYFVSGAGGAVKIGFTTLEVRKRISQFAVGSPVALVVLATVEGTMRLEAEYHRRFAAHRLQGEWFSPHPDILAEIDRLTTPAATIVEEV